MGVGLIATARYRPSAWSSNNRSDAASLFQIGQWMLQTIGLGMELIREVVSQLQEEVPKWG